MSKDGGVLGAAGDVIQAVGQSIGLFSPNVAHANDVATGRTSAEGDTLKVDRKLVLLEAVQNRRQIIAAGTASNEPTYGNKKRRFLIGLKIPEVVINHFGIPVTDENLLKDYIDALVSEKKQNTAIYYDLVSGASKSVSRDKTLERKAESTNFGITKQSARLVLLGKYTPKGRPFSVSIAFPYWFSKLMIGQALITMLKDNVLYGWISKEGKRFILSSAENKREPLAIGGTTSPHGAWLFDTSKKPASLEEFKSYFDGGYYTVNSTGGAMTRVDNKTVTAITPAP